MERVNCTTINNEVSINMNDICKTLNYNGKIKGYSNIIKYSNLENNIFSNISNNDIENAKAITIIFNLSPNISLSCIINSCKRINNLISLHCDFLFSTVINSDLKKDTIDYKILLTGL